MPVTKQQALEYHFGTRPGKIEVTPTKPCRTQHDLSLAYTPGVAIPCMEIHNNPHDAFKYTGRGNLVAVVTNGTAVLGLGDIGALAGKPVGIVAMGATQHHFLGVDWHLRDVLAWFGALVVPTSVYLASSDFVDGQLTEGAKQDLSALADAVIKLKDLAPAPGGFLGPKPLAARRY